MIEHRSSPPAQPGLSFHCSLLRGSLGFPQNQTAHPGAIPPFLPFHSPSRPCNTGITAWSPCWRMLGGNHGNSQVPLSLPLPITLRCHHVLATSRALRVPPRRGPRAVLGYVAAGHSAGDPQRGPRAGSRHPAPPRHPLAAGVGGGGTPARPAAVSPRWQCPFPAAPAEGARRGAPRNICKCLSLQPAWPFPK